MPEWVLTAVFVAGWVPSAALLLLYSWGGNWRTLVGSSFLALLVVVFLSYTSGLLVLLWPLVFAEGTAGSILRICIRVAIAVVLWYLLYALIRVQTRR